MKSPCFEIMKGFLFITFLSSLALASIEGTPHDLSALGGGNSCIFCHTPHGSMSDSPAWNHELSKAVYKIYQSSSLDAKVGQPTGNSKLCLSCHDGTVALTQTISDGMEGGGYIPPGSANLGTDLSDDHPISFVYSSALSAEDVQIRPAATLPEQLKLDRSDELQCTTCHDAHDNQYGNFLVMSNYHSEMCISCHDLKGWMNSSHQSSMASTSGTSDSYLQNSEYNTVSENGCLSCHRPHSAGGHERLLHFARSEDNCLNCHDGSVASTNLRFDLTKLSRHDVVKYSGVHDLKESPSVSARHVECVDCHNAHAVQDQFTQVPAVPGPMEKTTGITSTGNFTPQVQYGYEVCYKCHGDNPNRVQSKITRKITQTNTRLEFDPSNPSFHPVVSTGVNQTVPSLESPQTIATMISCTDCHNKDNSSGTKGPHGSNYPYLLAFNYETVDYDESFPRHRQHLEDEAPCSACHDPHGISFSQGNPINNSNLINFDITIVGAESSTGRLEFEDLGEFAGRCFLRCHDKEHSPEEY
ncbi:MAG: cytochrome c3 family protein [Planctomycetota bacterium]|jgi:predicted CXXCH cytochrome family protein